MQTYAEGKATQIWSLIPEEDLKPLTLESTLENGEISYSIEPGGAADVAFLITAYYDDERLLETSVTNLTLGEEMLTGSLLLPENCSKVRLFLTNKSYVPLCENREHAIQ